MKQGKKRMLCFFCAVVLLLSTLPLGIAATDGKQFSDVDPGAWYYDAVNTCVTQGLFEGTSETTFAPTAQLTREMFVTVLYRYAKSPAVAVTTLPFTDVTSGAWYWDAICWSHETEIVNGISETAFGTGAALTREQAATMLIRFLTKVFKYDVTANDSSFADQEQISGFAKDSVAKAFHAGLMKGKGGNCFAPKDAMTRAETAQILCNLNALTADHTHTYETVTRYVPATGGIQHYSIQVCQTCGDEKNAGDVENGRPAVLELTGDVTEMSKDNTVTLQAVYNAADQQFASFCTMKWQGSSSLVYEKKNYNIKLFSDDTLAKKTKVDLGWGKENKYCLKANYIDCTQSRNIVSARLWGDMVRSRVTQVEPLVSLVNGGAVDGYPVMLYINKVYQGLYTMNIPKDKWMLENDDHKVQAIMTTGDWDASCAFRENADINETHWEIEENAWETDEEAYASLNNLISFVRLNAGADFVNGIGTYLDVESYIDYMIFCMSGTMRDNTAKNCMFVTYDGVKWYTTMYDMDTSWGLYWDGASYYPNDMLVPKVNGTSITVDEVDNLLWSKMFSYYAPQIRARYFALRSSVLNETNIDREFSAFIGMIPQELMDAERLIYPKEPSLTTNNLNRINTYVLRHFKLLDAAIAVFPAE